MECELPRTLITVTGPYQRGFEPDEIEVIVVDNGSSTPPDPRDFPDNVQFLVVNDPTVSPARAVNLGLQSARAELVGVFIDGARMVSSGLCKYALLASKLYHRPTISTFNINFLIIRF